MLATALGGPLRAEVLIGLAGHKAQISEMWATQPNYTKDQLRAITVPTVIFDGDHDEGIKPAHTAEMAELIPGAKLVIMKDASHFAMWQKPDEFNAIVLEFLASK